MAWNITVQVLDLSTKNPINNLTQQYFSGPFLQNFQSKGSGLYTMSITPSHPKPPAEPSASIQVCAPGYVCEPQTIDTPNETYTVKLPYASLPSTTITALSGGTVPNGGTTVGNSITFTFTTTGGVSPYTYKCILDGASSSCTSPATFANLLPGLHQFSIQTTDLNGYGSTANFSWKVQLPITKIASAVDGNNAQVPNGGTSSSNSITFTFYSTSGGVPPYTYKCMVDGAIQSLQLGPGGTDRVGPLAPGSHQFSIQTTDHNGYGSIDYFSWTVQPPPPPSYSVSDAYLGQILEGTSVKYTLYGYNNNKIDFNLQLVIDQHPLHGSVSPNSPFPNPTTITYTAVTGYAGLDQFTYYAKDSQGVKSNTGTISITIDVGYSQIAIFNCNQDRRPIYIWLYDHSSGNWINKGSLDAQYDPISDFCPSNNAIPLKIQLTNGVRYDLSCLDPGLPACSSGSSNPTDVNCQRYTLPLILGDAKGNVLTISVP